MAGFPAWHERAVCAQIDMDMWFPEPSSHSREAKRICRGFVSYDPDVKSVPACPVRDDCLNAAIEADEEFGIWGGLSRKEREAEVKRRRLLAHLAWLLRSTGGSP